jgi:very-short-patch-repair endonuclease
VSNILSKLGIAFSTQVKFPGCRHTSLLKFDFYIPSANTLIEYDGAQHFTNVNFFGGEDGLAKRKLRDSIKTAWAKDNSYNLLRLDYTMSAETIRQKIMEELNIKEVA